MLGKSVVGLKCVLCVLAYSTRMGSGSKESVRNMVTLMNAISKICLSSALLGKLHGKGGKRPWHVS